MMYFQRSPYTKNWTIFEKLFSSLFKILRFEERNSCGNFGSKYELRIPFRGEERTGARNDIDIAPDLLMILLLDHRAIAVLRDH
jgi:hypothetical protein